METKIINIQTIHGNFDFKITPMDFDTSVKIESEILYDTYLLSNECVYNNDGELIDTFISIKQFETNIHLYDFPCKNLFIDFCFRIDLIEFENVINFILNEYN